MLRLSECREGEMVKISQVSAKGILRKRLLELGFLKGSTIRIVKYAPLRDPMEISIRDSHISLRVSEAQAIHVTRDIQEGLEHKINLSIFDCEKQSLNYSTQKIANTY